jgi:hypothetical protein
MDYALGAVVVLIALAFVGWPLVRPPRAVSPPAAPILSAAEQRAAIYRELMELELDQRLGKVDEADHRAQADALMAQAAALLAAEDATIESIDDELEREIAAQRRALHPTMTAAELDSRR